MSAFLSDAASLDRLQANGFVVLGSVLSANGLAAFRDEAARLAASEPDHAHGIRSLLQRSKVYREWAFSTPVRTLLPAGLQPVRGILFDKTPDANWKVAWHQDLTIAVEEKMDATGYGPWSVKDGTMHVQPPMQVLEEMVTLRLHLDDTPAENGALRVTPASHLRGRLDADEIGCLRQSTPEHICEAHAGDILLMKPLILHASSASAKPGHRRVVHVEYARTELLHPSLRWAKS